MHEFYDVKMASTEDRAAWKLCQLLDDDAPLHWTRHRNTAVCIAKSPTLMAELVALQARDPCVRAVNSAAALLDFIKGTGDASPALRNSLTDFVYKHMEPRGDDDAK